MGTKARKPMSPVRKAVLESIEEYRKKIANPIMAKTGLKNCPLCRMFHSEMNRTVLPSHCCEGCPVYLKTGKRYCIDTPYTSVHRIRMWVAISEADIGYGKKEERAKEFVRACEEEIEFLKSLISGGYA